MDRAERIARSVAWTMGLEAQNVSDQAIATLTRKLVAEQLALQLAER